MNEPTVVIPTAVVNLDSHGSLLNSASGDPVPGSRIADYLARSLPIPDWATDIYVHAHGWRTPSAAATGQAQRLLSMAFMQRTKLDSQYPKLADSSYRPWIVSICWPSSSGYRRTRDRAHQMGAKGRGHAAYVLAHLLGYLDQHRTNPGEAALANGNGQYLHLCGHSFGGRLLCEAAQWAAAPRSAGVLGWGAEVDPRRPFTVDSLVVFQMAAPRNAFNVLFTTLLSGEGPENPTPMRGPVVVTYSRYDRATGFWHMTAERSRGIGNAGVRLAPAHIHNIRLLPLDHVYTRADLDHPIVNVDASWRFRRRGLKFSGAHSDIYYPESAHLILSIAELCRW